MRKIVGTILMGTLKFYSLLILVGISCHEMVINAIDRSEQKQNEISFSRKTKVETTMSTFALRTF